MYNYIVINLKTKKKWKNSSKSWKDKKLTLRLLILNFKWIAQSSQKAVLFCVFKILQEEIDNLHIRGVDGKNTEGPGRPLA